MQTPYEILKRNESLFDLAINHQYIPQGSSKEVGEIFGAIKQLHPDFDTSISCQGCVMDKIRTAYRIYKSLEPTKVETKPEPTNKKKK